jgi:hypothetical protein
MNFTPEMLMRAAWERDRLIVPVPWQKAEAIQSYLRDHDVPSTLCLEPLTRDAYLEVHTNIGAEDVQVLLDCREG